MRVNKSKTIIYIGGFELPDKNAAAQRVIANGKLFRGLGYDVVFLGINKSLDSGCGVVETRKEYCGFEVWEVPYPTERWSWIKYITSCSALTVLVETIYKDTLFAIICYNHPFFAQLKIKKLCKKNKALYIPDVTEWYGSGGGGLVFNSLKWLDTTLRMRLLHPTGDGVIATSKYLREYYENKRCRVVELPTLFDTIALNGISTLPRCRKEGVKYLVYAGSPFDVKRACNDRKIIKDRLDLVIHLMGRLYDLGAKFELSIYGIGKREYLMVYPEHAPVLDKLEKHVIFFGRRPHNEVVKNIKNSDFTIFLRDVDRVTESGFPSKYSESISCGTPVITNMISNVEGYIVEGKNGVVVDLCDFNKQVEKMLAVMSMSGEEVVSMKNYCLASNLFDYRMYLVAVRELLKDIESDQ